MEYNFKKMIFNFNNLDILAIVASLLFAHSMHWLYEGETGYDDLYFPTGLFIFFPLIFSVGLLSYIFRDFHRIELKRKLKIISRLPTVIFFVFVLTIIGTYQINFVLNQYSNQTVASIRALLYLYLLLIVLILSTSVITSLFLLKKEKFFYNIPHSDVLIKIFIIGIYTISFILSILLLEFQTLILFPGNIIMNILFGIFIFFIFITKVLDLFFLSGLSIFIGSFLVFRFFFLRKLKNIH